MKYNSWPIGQVPIEIQRPELEQIKNLGYSWTDARDVIDIFEQEVAKFAGSKFAVAVDCCTNAIELSLQYLLQSKEISENVVIGLPKNTYISIPLLVKRLGFPNFLSEKHWTGIYQLSGTRVWDGAVRWRNNMYVRGSLQCVSFQIKKRIPIGKGGIILCDSEQERDWLRLARYDGRDMALSYDHPEHLKMRGYHYYMTPEDAARGLILMSKITEQGDTGDWTKYPDCSEMLKNT